MNSISNVKETLKNNDLTDYSRDSLSFKLSEDINSNCSFDSTGLNYQEEENDDLPAISLLSMNENGIILNYAKFFLTFCFLLFH
jgi:hypothetical protein